MLFISSSSFFLFFYFFLSLSSYYSPLFIIFIFLPTSLEDPSSTSGNAGMVGLRLSCTAVQHSPCKDLRSLVKRDDDPKADGIMFFLYHGSQFPTARPSSSHGNTLLHTWRRRNGARCTNAASACKEPWKIFWLM